MNFPEMKYDLYEGFRRMVFQLDGCECYVVEPSNPLPGGEKHWVWKAEFFSAFPKFELEMLRRGYYLAYITVGNTFGCPDAMKHWDVFHQFLTERLGFRRRAVLLGLSRGGLYIYNWGARNTDKLSCIYADNPVCDFKSWPAGKGVGPGSPDNWRKLLADYHFADEAEALNWKGNPVDNIQPFVDAKIPLIHAAGIDDDVVPICENTDRFEEQALKLGANIRVFRHPGKHHPHGLEDPMPLIEYLLRVAL